jgi:hypothetical protein
MGDSVLIVDALFRFDPRTFDRDAVMFKSEISEETEVLGISRRKAISIA